MTTARVSASGGGGITWRRGLFRVWIGVSLLWVLLLGMMLRGDIFATEDPGWRPGQVLTFEEFAAPGKPASAATIAGRLGHFAPGFLVPPALLLGLGLLGVWMVGGFRR